MGYSVEVKTWENDGDFIASKTISCETKADADFLVALAMLFIRNGLGNDLHRIDVIADSVKDVVKEHGGISPAMKRAVEGFKLDSINHDPKTNGYALAEWLKDNILGWSDNYEDDWPAMFCRVVDGIKVSENDQRSDLSTIHGQLKVAVDHVAKAIGKLTPFAGTARVMPNGRRWIGNYKELKQLIRAHQLLASVMAAAEYYETPREKK